MQEKTKLRIILYFTLAYLSFFTILAVFKGNYEFLYYAFVMAILITIAVLYYRKIHLHKSILIGATVLGVMHMLGGNVYIFGTRLYDLYLIPNIFRYDNLVHAFGVFLVTFIIYSLVYPHLDKTMKHNLCLLAFIIISTSTGIGAYNEIIELIAVLFLNASQAVGDYYNNSFDLVFNLFGSVIACFFLLKYHRTRHR
jgi:hypothetical protein